MSMHPELLNILREECKKTYKASDFQLYLMVEYIASHWDQWERNGDFYMDDEHVWTELRNYMWMNWAGGGTAQNVTDRIKERLESA